MSKYIDVWEVSDGSTSYVVESEQQARKFVQTDTADGIEGLTITKKKMETRKFKKLPEFDGF